MNSQFDFTVYEPTMNSQFDFTVLGKRQSFEESSPEVEDREWEEFLATLGASAPIDLFVGLDDEHAITSEPPAKKFCKSSPCKSSPSDLVIYHWPRREESNGTKQADMRECPISIEAPGCVVRKKNGVYEILVGPGAGQQILVNTPGNVLAEVRSDPEHTFLPKYGDRSTNPDDNYPINRLFTPRNNTFYIRSSKMARDSNEEYLSIFISAGDEEFVFEASIVRVSRHKFNTMCAESDGNTVLCEDSLVYEHIPTQ